MNSRPGRLSDKSRHKVPYLRKATGRRHILNRWQSAWSVTHGKSLITTTSCFRNKVILCKRRFSLLCSFIFATCCTEPAASEDLVTSQVTVPRTTRNTWSFVCKNKTGFRLPVDRTLCEENNAQIKLLSQIVFNNVNDCLLLIAS